MEAVFAAVFAWVLVRYARRRDPLQRDVAIMFSALAVLFVLEVIRQTVGEPPAVVADAASALLLGQPFLTLRLVRRVGAVPGWLYWSAFAAWLASAGMLISAEAGIGPATLLLVVAVFVATEVTAAVFFGRLARGRSGAPKTRLWLATAATALFAGAILVAGAGAGNPDIAGATSQAAQAIALLSAIGYLLAFVPPEWVRRGWSSRAAYSVVRQLLGAPAQDPPEAIWRRYAEAVCRATGSGGAVVLLDSSETGLREVARIAIPALAEDPTPGWDHRLDRTGTISLSAMGQSAPDLVQRYARASGARHITVTPLPTPAGRGVLLLLNRYPSLFTDDDVQLLGELGGQAAALAQRADLLADRDRLTGELSASVAALTKAGKAKSDFMANMSHELRTPLNAIIGFSDLMRTEPSSGDRTTVPTEWISHIHSSGAHLLGLINEVLDLAKIEAGKVDLSLEPLDLPQAVDDVVTGLAALSQRKGVEVTVAAAPLRVRADRMRFRQILTNLLSNAIKFTPDGGRIFLATRRAGLDIAISVADTGPGIAPADQQRIFDEFQQVGEHSDRAGGTGLGLALTRRLVEAHAGRIEVESEPGRGARFTVYLPAADTVPPAGADDPGPCADVLVIEDDPAAARLLSTHLEAAGYRVAVATSGERGLATARAGSPEAILLDIELPGMDGWQVLAELKGDDRLRHVPVVIISVVDDAEVGLALGAADYFVKPVDRRTLLSWLARHGLVPPMGREGLTVLAIDDDPRNLDLIEASLGAEGIHVTRAGGGVEGLKRARAHRFDLIICDLIMPDVDGFDVIAALHDDPGTRGIPVVVLTAHSLTAADKARLSGKVIAVTAKGDDPSRGLPDLARTIGELTGLNARLPDAVT